MAKLTKRQKNFTPLIVRNKKHSLADAVGIIKKTATAKFDESVDLAVKLGVDPRKSDQMVRGTCELPNGTGKKVRLVALTKGPKGNEAKEAGADIVGGDDIIAKIEGGWLDFDVLVVTPDMMGAVGKIGKILGPRGLMPNPKNGTVAMDLPTAVARIKAGQVSFKVDKAGIVHVPVGRASFSDEKLAENVRALMETVRKVKPSSAKGVYLKSITLNTTMGPAVSLESSAFI